MGSPHSSQEPSSRNSPDLPVRVARSSGSPASTARRRIWAACRSVAGLRSNQPSLVWLLSSSPPARRRPARTRSLRRASLQITGCTRSGPWGVGQTKLLSGPRVPACWEMKPRSWSSQRLSQGGPGMRSPKAMGSILAWMKLGWPAASPRTRL